MRQSIIDQFIHHILIYLILAAQFESFKDPFIIMLTVPLAICGALIFMYFNDQTMNIFSQIGIIMLIGLVAKNGILIVEFANQKQEAGVDKQKAIREASVQRLRPILMTTLTTVLAMLQMVFSGDMASQLMSGMAIVIICGLSYATLMTLYIVPILYDVLFKKPPLSVDVGSDDDLDDIPDDAAEFIAAQKSAGTAQPEA